MALQPATLLPATCMELVRIRINGHVTWGGIEARQRRRVSSRWWVGIKGAKSPRPCPSHARTQMGSRCKGCITLTLTTGQAPARQFTARHFATSHPQSLTINSISRRRPLSTLHTCVHNAWWSLYVKQFMHNSTTTGKIQSSLLKVVCHCN